MKKSIYAAIALLLSRHTKESGRRDLNPRPLRPERSALPSCATARSIKYIGSAQNCRHRPLNTHRIQRLNDPPIRPSLLGQVNISLAIQQHQNPSLRRPSHLRLHAEIQASRHPPHIADLKIANHHIRTLLPNGVEHLDTSPYPADFGCIAAQCSIYRVEHGVAVGGQEHMRHTPMVSKSMSAQRAGEMWLADGFEAVPR